MRREAGDVASAVRHGNAEAAAPAPPGTAEPRELGRDFIECLTPQREAVYEKLVVGQWVGLCTSYGDQGLILASFSAAVTSPIVSLCFSVLESSWKPEISLRIESRVL